MTLLPRRGRRSGATAVEFAVIAIILFMVIFGILEYGRYVMVLQIFNNAAREGARYAVVNTTNPAVTTATVQTYVDGYLGGQGNQLQSYNKTTNITVYQADPVTGANNSNAWANAGPGVPIGVEINGNYNPILPTFLFMPSPITISAKAIMYPESP